MAPATEPRPPLASDGFWPTGGTAEDRTLSTPVIAGGIAVSVGPSTVEAFDPGTGELTWSIARGAGQQPLPAIPASVDPSAGPAGAGVVVFTEGRGATDSSLVVADLASGKRVWNVPMGGLALGAPTIADGSAFAGSRDGLVHRIELDNGKSQTLPTTGALEGYVDVAPAVSGGRVFVAAQNETTGRVRLYALDEMSGGIAWSYSPSRTALGVSSATVADGTVYVGFGDLTVRAFEAATGTLLWTQPVRDLFSPRSSPSYVDGDLYVLDEGGGVYSFDGTSGARRWDFQFASFSTSGAPLVVGGYIYVGLDDGTMAAISRSSGHLVWRTTLAGGPIGALAPAAGGIMLAPALGKAGGVVALHHVDGTLIDERSPTELRLPSALVGFAAAFGAVFAFLLLLFRFAVRPRRPRAPEGEWHGAGRAPLEDAEPDGGAPP